jgi:hypothetical protein
MFLRFYFKLQHLLCKYVLNKNKKVFLLLIACPARGFSTMIDGVLSGKILKAHISNHSG